LEDNPARTGNLAWKLASRDQPPAERLQAAYELGCAFPARIEPDELIPLVMGNP